MAIHLELLSGHDGDSLQGAIFMIPYTGDGGRESQDLVPWDVPLALVTSDGTPMIEQAHLVGMSDAERVSFYMGVARDVAMREMRSARGRQVRDYTKRVQGPPAGFVPREED